MHYALDARNGPRIHSAVLRRFRRLSPAYPFGHSTGAGALADTLQNEKYVVVARAADDSFLVRDSETPANNVNGRIDDILNYLNASAKPVFGWDGVMRYQAHNLLDYSEDLTQWSLINNPSVSGQKITAPAGGNDFGLYLEAPITAGLPYRFSLTVEEDTHSYVYVHLRNGAGLHYTTAVFDLSAGDGSATETDVGGDASIISTSITGNGDGTYNLELIATNLTGTSGTLQSIGFAKSNTGNNFSSVGRVLWDGTATGTEAFYLHKAQFSKYPCDDIYIKTEGAARWFLPVEWDQATLVTSSTSLVVLNGIVGLSRTFAYTGDVFTVGADVRAYDSANPTTNYLVGKVTAASSGSVTIAVFRQVGSGTVSDWKLVQCKGWLIEPAATNYMPLSLADTGFAAAGTTPPTVADTQTWLGETCTKITFPSGAAAGYGGSRVSRTGAGSYLALSAGDYVGGLYISLSRELTGAESIVFYFTGSAAGNQTAISSANSADFVGRFVRMTSSTPTHPGGTFYPVIFNGNSSTLTSDLDVYVHSGDVQPGTVLTSHIRTAGSSLSRLADAPYLDVADLPWNEDAWSAVVSYMPRVLSSTTNVLNFMSSSGLDRVTLPTTQNTYQPYIASGGVISANPTAGTIVADQMQRLAFALAQDDFASSLDGGVPATDTSGDMPSGISKIYIGAFTTTAQLNGHIQSFKYLPRRITNAELQSESTL